MFMCDVDAFEEKIIMYIFRSYINSDKMKNVRACLYYTFF